MHKEHINFSKYNNVVHLDGMGFHHSPDNQLLQRPFVTLIYLTHEQQVALTLQSLTLSVQPMLQSTMLATRSHDLVTHSYYRYKQHPLMPAPCQSLPTTAPGFTTTTIIMHTLILIK